MTRRKSAAEQHFATSFSTFLLCKKQSQRGGKKSAVAWNNWNSRPGFSFMKHSLSMNAPGESPYVSDTKFSYRNGGNIYDMEGYGPYNANILRNWVRKGRKRCSTPAFDSDL